MESHNKVRREDSVENIGVIVDFEEEEDESDPEANELASSLNHVINISIDELKPRNTTKDIVSDKDGSKFDCEDYEKTPESPQDLAIKTVNSQRDMCDVELANKASKYDLYKECPEDNEYCSDAEIDKERENTNQPTNPVVSNNAEPQHFYENESERNGYENINQSDKDEHLYEEINFQHISSSILLEADDNYINVRAVSILNLRTEQSTGSLEKCCQTVNILDETSSGVEMRSGRRRWSSTQEEDYQPAKQGQGRWSLKGSQAIRSILKQNNQKGKNVQNVNFRAKVKVKTFREASSMAYEPIDVVDYVTVKGEHLNHYDVPKPLSTQPSGWERCLDYQEGQYDATTQTELGGKRESCSVM